MREMRKRNRGQKSKERQDEIVREVERPPDQVPTSGSGVGGKRDERREKEPLDIIISRVASCGRQDSEVARRASSSCAGRGRAPLTFRSTLYLLPYFVEPC